MQYSISVSDDPLALEAVFATWQTRWRAMQALAHRRGWLITPLDIAPPATPAEMDALGALATACGLAVPDQLRTVLGKLSARVTFGWRIPALQLPDGSLAGLTAGGLRDTVWSLQHIERYALANFANWRAQLETRSGGERPNRRKQWQNQFAIAELVNGDMLTIDCSQALGTEQPVRYFSHELEGLHGAAIAPDFLTFIDRYSELGCAGGEHSDWFRFCTKAGELRADTKGAHGWKRWCEGGRSAIGRRAARAGLAARPAR